VTTTIYARATVAKRFLLKLFSKKFAGSAILKKLRDRAKRFCRSFFKTRDEPALRVLPEIFLKATADGYHGEACLRHDPLLGVMALV
jgi:hypothetical protein